MQARRAHRRVFVKPPAETAPDSRLAFVRCSRYLASPFRTIYILPRPRGEVMPFFHHRNPLFSFLNLCQIYRVPVLCFAVRCGRFDGVTYVHRTDMRTIVSMRRYGRKERNSFLRKLAAIGGRR